MIVVAMIAVIAAIALPRLDPFLPERRLRSAARLLSGAITLAYGEAIAKNKTYRLYMDTSTDRGLLLIRQAADRVDPAIVE